MMNLLRAAPESVGISSGALLSMLRKLNELDSLNGIVLLRHGKVCMEGWWKPYCQDVPHGLFSLSKSLVSVAIGIAQGEKLLSLDDRLISFFPEHEKAVTDPKMNEITLRHLLTMTSGHDVCAKEFMINDPEGDWAHGFLASRLPRKPGEFFAYNSGATYMLAAVIFKRTGQNVREYLMPRFFEPLGIVPGIWETCPKGINCGGHGLFLKTEDIAKLAQLLLNHGKVNGKALIPEDYLAEATRKQSDNSMNQLPDWKCGYGYQFWVSRHGYRGDGASGQYLIVLPQEDVAIAVNSCLADMGRILDVFWDALLPALQDAPLPEDSRKHRALERFLASLAIPPARNAYPVTRCSSARFEFESNAAGITACSVEFGEKECALTFFNETPLKTEQLRAGFGFHCMNTFRLSDVFSHPVAASAAWVSEDVLEIHAFCCDTTFRDVYRIDFNDPLTPLIRTSSCSTFRPLLCPLFRKQES